MPYTGEPSFLLYDNSNLNIVKMESVNALYGRTIISTVINGEAVPLIRMCQCPIRANHHFYALVMR